MEIGSKAYGKVEIREEDIFTFDSGIIGFEDKKKYVLLGQSEENEILVWFQSVEDENLAFVVIKPTVFRPDYQPKIHVDDLAGLDVGEDTSDLLVYTMVVVPEDINKMTANLRAPLIMNKKNNKAKQIVLNDDTYQVKEPFFVNK